jgi:hypothetical protein
VTTAERLNPESFPRRQIPVKPNLTAASMQQCLAEDISDQQRGQFREE